MLTCALPTAWWRWAVCRKDDHRRLRSCGSLRGAQLPARPLLQIGAVTQSLNLARMSAEPRVAAAVCYHCPGPVAELGRVTLYPDCPALTALGAPTACITACRAPRCDRPFLTRARARATPQAAHHKVYLQAPCCTVRGPSHSVRALAIVLVESGVGLRSASRACATASAPIPLVLPPVQPPRSSLLAAPTALKPSRVAKQGQLRPRILERNASGLARPRHTRDHA